MIRLEAERFYKEDGCFGRIRVKWINDHILLMNDNDEAYSWFGGVCRAHPYGKEPRRIVYDDNLIHTPRMLLRMLGDEEMQKIIDEEKDPEMVQAYQEMYTGCLEHPQQRAWYVIWGMELPDGTRPSGCLKRPALCQTA